MEMAQQQIQHLFNASATRYVSFKKLLATLPLATRKELGLKPASPQDEILRALEKAVSDFGFHKKGRVWYLVSGTEEQVVAAHVANKPKTLKQLAHRGFVYTVKDTARIVNRLVEKGEITLLVAPSGLALMQKAGSDYGHEEPPVPHGIQKRVEAFKNAFDFVGKGRRFVYIHLIRRRLSWPKEVFDQVLDYLMVNGHVAGHTGDPGALSAREVADAYKGPLGDLYLTVGWRKAL